MVSVTENYSKFEVHMVVRFLESEEMSQNEIYSRSVNLYNQNIF
jgi:hypothetical protein